MPRRISFKENHYYHIYNRGLDKQALFHSPKDFERFLYYMALYKEKCIKDLGIIAYSILPNHFHFVLYNKTKFSKISYFIGNVCASYTRYYKIKYGTEKGFVFFEGRFKSKLLDNEEYLNQCIQYVELNSIKHGLVDNIDDRLFTSYDKNKSTKPNLELLNIDREF